MPLIFTSRYRSVIETLANRNITQSERTRDKCVASQVIDKKLLVVETDAWTFYRDKRSRTQINASLSFALTPVKH